MWIERSWTFLIALLSINFSVIHFMNLIINFELFSSAFSIIVKTWPCLITIETFVPQLRLVYQRITELVIQYTTLYTSTHKTEK